MMSFVFIVIQFCLMFSNFDHKTITELKSYNCLEKSVEFQIVCSGRFKLVRIFKQFTSKGISHFPLTEIYSANWLINTMKSGT